MPHAHPVASDPIDTMLAHNRWANRAMLELCRPLSHEQFHRKFPIGLGDRGGLHLTFTHIISASGRWADRIRGVTPVRAALEPMPFAPPPGALPPDAKDRTVDDLLELNDRFCDDLADAAAFSRREGLASTFVFTYPSKEGPKSYTFTRVAALLHALMHAHYHRAQANNMLRHLGVPGVSDKLLDVSVVDWQGVAGEPGLPAAH